MSPFVVLNVILLSVVTLSVIMLSVIMLSVIMQSVVAPNLSDLHFPSPFDLSNRNEKCLEKFCQKMFKWCLHRQDNKTHLSGVPFPVSAGMVLHNK